MKTLAFSFLLLISFSAISAEHGYWVEESLCGEIDPFAIGDACLVNVANHEENFVIILDHDFVMNAVAGGLDHAGLLIEKKGLRKATKAQFAAMDGFQKKLKVFTIDESFVTFADLSNEE